MTSNLPAIILTGASGLIGKYLLENLHSEYLVYAIARRSQREAGVAEHPNIKWIQVDIANWTALKAVMYNIKRQGGVDFVLHLAGYYDFTYENNPEYERTNVHGTRHMLELAKWLCVRRFVFASSLAACEFRGREGRITERTSPDARYAYAISKRRGEHLTEKYARWFPCSVVRFAAVFSDWCEYPPLYSFLKDWLSDRPKARVIGGKGTSAISYIHITELSRVLRLLLRRSDRLPSFDVYCASPNGCTSHLELFKLATRFYFGRERKPIFIPRLIAVPGVYMLDLLGRLRGHRPFLRPWMMRYINQRLDVDATYTQRTLGWEPVPRSDVLRRILFLIEKMKSSPEEWWFRNEAMLRRVAMRPSLVIYEELAAAAPAICSRVVQELRSPLRKQTYAHYQAMPVKDLERDIGLLYELLTASIRTGNRTLLLNYTANLTPVRFEMGFPLEEVKSCLRFIDRTTLEEARSIPRLHDLERETYDAVSLTMQLVIDEVEYHYERHTEKGEGSRLPPGEGAILRARSELQHLVERLNAFYRVMPEDEDEIEEEIPRGPEEAVISRAARGGE